LASLLLERPYDQISVTDIAAQANVGRASFYAHYRCKDDLLREQLALLVDALVEFDTSAASPDVAVDGTRLFAHIRDAYRYYRAVMSGPSGAFVTRAMTETIAARVHGSLADRPRPARQEADVPLPVLAHFVASTLVSLLVWWVDTNMRETPERMQHIFRTLVGSPLVLHRSPGETTLHGHD
jgi:AcrR family transcriptional regulator